MTVGERIKRERENRRITQIELATGINVTKQNLYKYENNIISNIPSDKIEAIAEYLNISPALLMGWEEENIYSYENIIPLPETELVPLLGRIACGTPTLAEGNVAEYLKVEKNYHADFALECKGDSMINARIFDGDIVFIIQQEMVENGEIAAVLIDNEATLKRVYIYKNRVELRAENPTFKTIEFEKEDINKIKILGKAVAFSSIII